MQKSLSVILKLIIIYLIVSLCAVGTAYAEEANKAKSYAKKVFFHIDLTGKGSNDEPILRQGKAFAISKDTLLTARHVVGNRNEFYNQGIDGGVYLPKRTAEIYWMNKYSAGSPTFSTKNLFIRSSGTDTVDVSRLKVPNMDMTDVQEFKIDGCGIDPEQVYSVLVTYEKPEIFTSIKKPILIDLTPVDYNPTKFGELYVFSTDDPERPIEKGDSGSPVINSEGHVVGILTGYYNIKGNQKILVTLVDSFLPLIPPNIPIKCLRDICVKNRLDGHIEFTITKFKNIDDKISSLAPKINWSLRFQDNKVLEIRADKILDSAELHVKKVYVEGKFGYVSKRGNEYKSENFETFATRQFTDPSLNIFTYPIDIDIRDKRARILKDRVNNKQDLSGEISFTITPIFEGDCTTKELEKECEDKVLQNPHRSRFFVLDWIFHDG